MRRAVHYSLLLFALLFASCLNPFAPGIDDSPAESACNLSSTNVEGWRELFQCFQASYTFRDTTLYGQMLDPGFVFVYRDYVQGIDITWGRDEEMRTTFGLFQNAQRLDLIWNNIVTATGDPLQVNVLRGFNLTITFNPSDIERVDGYANLTFQRRNVDDPWRIILWRDESNF